jgi:DNA modification methylase
MNPDLHVVTVAVDDLVPDPENARKHSARNLEAIAGSLRLFGQRRPLVVHGQVVIAGNGTLEAAKSLGWSHVAITRTPPDWTVEQARAYALADNRTAELAEWDDEILAGQLVELDAVGWDLAEFGFEALEPPTDPEQREDEVPEVPDQPVSRVGDLWLVGEHRILCGDSSDQATLDRVFGDATVGCVLTDPPYGISLDTGKRHTGLGGLLNGVPVREYRPVANDDRPFDATFLYGYFAEVKEQFWFGANYYRRTISDPDLAGSWLVWDKRNPATDSVHGSGFELLWSRQKHKQDLLRFFYSGAFGAEASNRLHPTQKPTALLIEILGRWSAEGCIVADPFAGSGSTLVAAAKSGRIGYGIELDPGYVDVIVKRLEQETGEVARRDDG